MKRASNPVLDENFKFDNRTCLVCNKKTQGYGSWQAGFTCSRKCEQQYEETRPKLMDYIVPKGENHDKS